jgi:hypothetical protein
MLLAVWSIIAIQIIALLYHITPQVDTFPKVITIAFLYGFIFFLGLACTYLILGQLIKTFKQ